MLKKYFGLFLGVLTLALLSLSSIYPRLVDIFYFRYVFQGIRLVYDYTLGFLPFPMVYILFFLLVYYIAYHLRKVYAQWEKSEWLKSSGREVLQVSSMLGWIVFVFYMIWGVNYKRTPLDTSLGIDFYAPIEEDQILEEAQIVTHMRAT